MFLFGEYFQRWNVSLLRGWLLKDQDIDQPFIDESETQKRSYHIVISPTISGLAIPFFMAIKTVQSGSLFSLSSETLSAKIGNWVEKRKTNTDLWIQIVLFTPQKTWLITWWCHRTCKTWKWKSMLVYPRVFAEFDSYFVRCPSFDSDLLHLDRIDMICVLCLNSTKGVSTMAHPSIIQHGSKTNIKSSYIVACSVCFSDMDVEMSFSHRHRARKQSTIYLY